MAGGAVWNAGVLIDMRGDCTGGCDSGGRIADIFVGVVHRGGDHRRKGDGGAATSAEVREIHIAGVVAIV